MRNVLCRTLTKYSDDERLIFLTGDLGFMALEPLRDVMGPRFINAGVAEQNMVSVAAGLAATGLRPWVYSIAPFIYARPFEQIRNDVCMHDLPVVLIGNGGGYAYGAMGATHHALEDYGTLSGLPNMHSFVPAFGEDVPVIIKKLTAFHHPAYLRLGRCEKPDGFELPPYAPWRRLLEGKGETMLITGPLAGGILGRLLDMDEALRPSLWVLSELPVDVDTIPDDFISDVRRTRSLFVAEEHVAHGGLGQMIVHALASRGEELLKFTHRCARGYESTLYGSQKFHRRECGLDPSSIAEALRKKT